jgi:hypothetical protein
MPPVAQYDPFEYAAETAFPAEFRPRVAYYTARRINTFAEKKK